MEQNFPASWPWPEHTCFCPRPLFTQGGGLHELYSEYPPPVNRQTHEVRALWQAWSRVVGEELLTTAASSSGTVKQRINAVKTLILRHMMQVASSYIHNKVLASGWTGGISWSWLSQAITASKRWIPSMARFTLLRWAVNEDDDDWLARRGISRSKGCAFLCQHRSHVSIWWLSSCNLRELHLPQANHSVYRRRVRSTWA